MGSYDSTILLCPLYRCMRYSSPTHPQAYKDKWCVVDKELKKYQRELQRFKEKNDELTKLVNDKVLSLVPFLFLTAVTTRACAIALRSSLK